MWARASPPARASVVKRSSAPAGSPGAGCTALIWSRLGIVVEVELEGLDAPGTLEAQRQALAEDGDVDALAGTAHEVGQCEGAAAAALYGEWVW